MGRTRSYPRSQSSLVNAAMARHQNKYKINESRWFEYKEENPRLTAKALQILGTWFPKSQSWHWRIYSHKNNRSSYVCSVIALPKWLADKKDMSGFTEITKEQMYGGYDKLGYRIDIY